MTITSGETKRIVVPALITKSHIAEAIRCINRDGVPSRRRSRGYCLVTNGEHLPPKYTLALAHQVVTGEFLRSGQFSGGEESNDFLRRRGFNVVECNCGGNVHDGPITTVPGPSERGRSTIASTSHPSGVGNARYGFVNFWSAYTGPACPITDSAGKPASPLTPAP